MRKLTLTLLGASLLAGSLFAGQNSMTNMDFEKCLSMHKSIHSEASSKNLTQGEKALNFIQSKYGEQDDVREYNN